MLALRGCGYRYPGADRWAFQDVNLQITPGEIILLRGRNGSGKSTVLKVVCGILKPTSGTAIADDGVSAVYMDQSADEMLAFDLTVREHLLAFRHDLFTHSQTLYDRLHEFGIGLETRLDEFVGHLSGGQRQIIALLSTVESGANLLCLDEFLSALDVRSVQVATALIQQFVKTKKVSVLAVSHLPVDLSVDREFQWVNGTLK